MSGREYRINYLHWSAKESKKDKKGKKSKISGFFALFVLFRHFCFRLPFTGSPDFEHVS